MRLRKPSVNVAKLLRRTDDNIIEKLEKMVSVVSGFIFDLPGLGSSEMEVMKFLEFTTFRTEVSNSDIKITIMTKQDVRNFYWLCSQSGPQYFRSFCIEYKKPPISRFGRISFPVGFFDPQEFPAATINKFGAQMFKIKGNIEFKDGIIRN